jgi:glutathione S-transferase
MITLYDSDRCPFCARVRIVLAEKRIPYEPVAIDLRDRPAWLYEKNPLGKVPVLEEDAFTLPESVVIMEYLEERYPEPALLPADAAERAAARLAVHQFDERLGDDYYAFRRGDANRLEERLASLELDDGRFGLAEIAYLPWVLRARDLLGVTLPPALDESLARLSERPSVAAEAELVRTL